VAVCGGLNGEKRIVTATSNGRLILCVDDDANGLFVRKMTLESRGYRVLTAENGPDGISLFASEPIDLVLLDFMMPGMNGDVVAERMRGLKASVPILLLSAYVDLPHETFERVDKYMTKGDGPVAMLKAIEELLDHAARRSKARAP
jgi:CheY-like chemotaxis protein